MKRSELKQLIVESIQEYMRSIDEAGNIAALEAKMNKIDEEIQLREDKIGRVNELAELQEFVDPAKINEIKKEIAALKKGKEKYKKQLDYFVSLLDLPSYCSVKLIENKPYDVKVQLVINFPEMLKDAEIGRAHV